MHPQSYLAVQQLADDRRRELERGIRAAQIRTQARAGDGTSRNSAVWSRALRSVRLLSGQATS